EMAGYLHDLGKIAIPGEILQKPGSLDREEFNTVKAHPYHTYNTLKHIPFFEGISQWAGYHHERLDGEGYPFRLKDEELSLGCKIMAVADVFTALTEERPYRKCSGSDSAMRVIRESAKKRTLDPDISALLDKDCEEVTFRRAAAQDNAQTQYFRVLAGIEAPKE
ncbi:MAG: HD domain-containing protein, partial [Elusimicrobia bacterium]|nr:HD domain-containing protein [Elusimicrobiota bacterium]